MKLQHKLLVVITFFIPAIYSCKTMLPLAPPKGQAEVPVIEQPVSNIEIPVSADLRKYFVQAENSVPNQYSDSQQPCEGLSYKYIFKRTPFSIAGNSNVVDLKFTGSYGIWASYCAKCADIFGTGTQCVVPAVTASCGMGDEGLRRMVISYRSIISVQPDYHLKSKTLLYPAPNPIDKCSVSILKIDITDRLIGYLADPLNKLGAQVDDKIAAFDVKPMVLQLWNNMAGEIKLPDIGYLNLNLQSVRLSSFNLSGSVLNFSVGISAKPVVSTVSNNPPLKPLPNLSAYTPASGFNIFLDINEDYDKLTDMVNQQVVGQVIPIAGKQFIITGTKVYGIGKQIVMAVDFKGSMTGTIYLVGTPVYNPQTRELSFPDMNFDIQTKSWMLHAAKWMFSNKITDAIRDKAKYNLTQFLNDSKLKLQTQMSKDMGNGVRSDVTITDLNINNIFPVADKLVLRTYSSGQIKVKVVL